VTTQQLFCGCWTLPHAQQSNLLSCCLSFKPKTSDLIQQQQQQQQHAPHSSKARILLIIS
jgi:hypothetical protein